MSDVKLFQGDCLEIMPKLANDCVKVDLVLTDPPYGTTACKWDSIIPFDEMWTCLNQVTYENTPIVLFGSEPFSSALRMSNIKDYKYDWIWIKTKPSNHLNAKKQPMRKNELISVFYKKQCLYNPQNLLKGSFNNNRPSKNTHKNGNSVYGEEKPIGISEYSNYPNNLLFYSNKNNHIMHPTQKPVKLLEYLIKTYTKENDTVLDFTMGSGSTGVACLNTNRNFIGIELEPKYFEIAEQRIKEAKAQRRLI